MKTLPVFENQNLRDLLPLKVSLEMRKVKLGRFKLFVFQASNQDVKCFQLEEPDEGCLRPDKDVFCFQGGDARSNENMVKISVKSDIFNP